MLHKGTKRYYEIHARNWVERKTNSFYHEKQFRLFENMLSKGAKVIDIGCAGGVHVPLFLGIGRKLDYHGIDTSKKMIEIAQSRYPQLTFEVADTATYTSKKKYDAFWAAAVLMHSPRSEWPELLENIERLTVAGATGYIVLPSKRPDATIEDTRHFECFTKQQFKRLVEPRGWHIEKCGTFPKNWHWYIVKLP